jgi:peptidoglycan/xylan/chitin deacetylase (PgdA/CDA1 family)
VRSRLRHGKTTRALVLLYHRVAEPERDPQLLAVSPAHFEEHLHVLASRGGAVPLRELRGRRSGVAITFDDGYADNLPAAERLAAAGLPATVFVAAGLLGETPWWDELAERTQVESGWDVLAADGGAAAERYRELFARLRPLPHDERAAALRGLGGEAAPEARIVTEAELRALAGIDGVEVGAHTCTHPVLATLAPAAREAEVAGSKRRLEQLLGAPVTSFAYPYGSREDYDAETVAAVRAAGFARACANEPARLRARCDPYRIPRFLVRDWDGDAFARELDRWLA